MRKFKTDAIAYLPKESTDTAEEFLEVCGIRAETYYRVGSCTTILNRNELKEYWSDWGKISVKHIGF